MSRPALSEIAELVRHETGILFTDAQMPSLAAAVDRAAPGVEPEAVLRMADGPAGDRQLVDRLIEEVTVKETFFFRNFDELRRIDWPALARAGHARVWCAACASGEEAYSLAILALEAFAPGGPPPVSILATDIAPSALERAVAGRYGRRSVRNVEPAALERWFRGGPDGFEIGPQARALVSFEQHNLVRDPAPPRDRQPFDLILCRNVLIYFSPEAAERAVRALEGALRPGGLLVLGAADRLRVAPARGQGRTPAGGRSSADRQAGRPPAATRAPGRERRRRETARAEAPAHPGPPESEAAYLDGLEHLRAGRATAAVDALRRALYLDPGSAVAAFALGRAHEAMAGAGAARRAYWQALRLLEEARPGGLEPGDAADLASACRARLTALRPD